MTAGMYTDPPPSYIPVILSDSGINDEKFREGGERERGVDYSVESHFKHLILDPCASILVTDVLSSVAEYNKTEVSVERENAELKIPPNQASDVSVFNASASIC